MEKVVRFLKYMWLLVAVISFGIATYQLIIWDVTGALFFYFFTGMSTLLYFIRKRQLNRFENMSK